MYMCVCVYNIYINNTSWPKKIITSHPTCRQLVIQSSITSENHNKEAIIYHTNDGPAKNTSDGGRCQSTTTANSAPNASNLVWVKKADPAQHRQVPLGRTITATPPTLLNPPKRPSNRLCKFLCWTVGLLVLLLIIVGATAIIIYLVFQPKLPKYSVDNLRISDLKLNFDLSLYARFNVRITADNPNKKIGIYYENGSHLSVWYKKTNLCQGSIPRFYQGHQNRTVLNVALSGTNQYGGTLLDAMQEELQMGRIPLDLKIDVPVSIELRKLKLAKVRILGSCMLTVDSRSTNSFIRITASTCNFGLKL